MRGSCSRYFLEEADGGKRDREPFVGGRPGLNVWCQAFQELFDYASPRMREMAEELFGKRA